MITRKIGSFLRGQTTPFQIYCATVIGATIGVTPGFAQAPGLHVALLLLLLVLNANVFVAGLAWLLGMAVALVAMPVSFYIGRALIDGPTEPIFTWMINAPVLALFGFDHYATSGALVLGPIVGALFGLSLSAGLRRFRTTMARLEEDSERFQHYSSRRSVRLLTFVFIGGGHGKKTYRELIERRLGNPIRLLGVLIAVLAIGVLFLVMRFASGPIVTAMLKAELEHANGATVDVDRARLDVGEGRLLVEGLAIADPNRLSTDLLRAERVEADVTTRDLLRKRVVLDRVVLVDAQHGVERATPGKLTRPAPAPGDDAGKGADEKDLDDYVREAEKWKERLAQVKRWLEEMEGDPVGDEDEDDPESQTLEERLAQQIRALGWGRVRATHRIDGAPTLLVRELVAEKVRTAELENETIDVHGENLSTHPALTEGTARLTITSSGGTISAGVERAATGHGRIALELSGLSGDAIGKALSGGEAARVAGGTVDASADGRFVGGNVDIPLSVTLHDATVSLPGASPHTVKTMTFPITIRGPLDDPVVEVDDEALANALVAAGADELADQLRAKVSDQLGDELPEGTDKIVDDALKGIGDLLKGGK